jgi:hypothetical protein
MAHVKSFAEDGEGSVEVIIFAPAAVPGGDVICEFFAGNGEESLAYGKRRKHGIYESR